MLWAMLDAQPVSSGHINTLRYEPVVVEPVVMVRPKVVSFDVRQQDLGPVQRDLVPDEVVNGFK